MDELRPGLWTWTAPHPEWTRDAEGWEREVRSYAYDAGDALVLFDPLVSADEIGALAERRPITIVLTCRWHVRSSPELVRRFDATVHAPVGVDGLGVATMPYVLGEDLPGDVEPQGGGYPDEATLWLREHAALVVGDVFLGGERGFHVQPDSWLTDGMTHDELRRNLRPLLDLPVEMLLPTHGNPVLEDAHATLERTLDPT